MREKEEAGSQDVSEKEEPWITKNAYLYKKGTRYNVIAVVVVVVVVVSVRHSILGIKYWKAFKSSLKVSLTQWAFNQPPQ